MVPRNVPKLHGIRSFHGLIGLGALAAAIAGPIGCGDDAFSGCKATRTCPPKDDTGGSGGESGGGNDTGGSAGSGSSGRSGSGGADDGGNDTGGNDTGGTGGNAGSGGAGDDEPPTVVSFTPADSDADVERNVEVTAELSEPIDEATVTTASVTLEGPDGEVSGTLSVEDNVITFVPDEPLNLLGTYTFTLADTLADLAGNTLADSESAEFQVRDGRWSTPTYPFGKTVSRTVGVFQRNASGDGVVGMTLSPNEQTIYGSVYQAAADQWTAAAEIRTSNAAINAIGVSVDPMRRAVVTWSDPNNSVWGWSRFTDSWVNSGGLADSARVAVSSIGEATAIYIGQTSYVTRTQDLSDGSIDPEIPFTAFVPDGSPIPLASLDRMAVIGMQSLTDTKEMVISWKISSGWGAAETLASATEIFSFNADSDEQGNIVVVWREGDQIWSRLYSRAENQWTRELFVTTAPTSSVLRRLDMTAGNAIISFEDANLMRASAIYEAGVGWIDDSIVTLDDTSNTAVAVSIDTRGNALAVWGNGFQYRRYVAGEGWLAASSLPNPGLNLDFGIWAAGAPDGSVLIVGTDTGGTVRPLPWTIRFE
jgi:hypothetical protein